MGAGPVDSRMTNGHGKYTIVGSSVGVSLDPRTIGGNKVTRIRVDLLRDDLLHGCCNCFDNVWIEDARNDK